MPEELIATCADKIFVQPTPRSGRNALADALLFNWSQFTAASHATRFANRQSKLAEHQRELFSHRQCGRKPKCGNDAVAQNAPLHHQAVGGQNGRAQPLRLAQQFGIIDVRLPERLVTRGAQPSRQTAQSRIAQKRRTGIPPEGVGHRGGFDPGHRRSVAVTRLRASLAESVHSLTQQTNRLLESMRQGNPIALTQLLGVM